MVTATPTRVSSKDDVRAIPAELTGVVQLLKLFADETRLQILFQLLQRGEANVQTLCRRLGQTQPAVSHHLALLREAGMVRMRRSGKHNFYRVDDTDSPGERLWTALAPILRCRPAPEA